VLANLGLELLDLGVPLDYVFFLLLYALSLLLLGEHFLVLHLVLQLSKHLSLQVRLLALLLHEAELRFFVEVVE